MKISFQLREFKDLKTFCGWRIWQKPKPTSIYAIGVDVAEGVNRDASVAQVLDTKNGLLVASFWSNTIDIDNYSAELYKAGHYYNKAGLIIEANNHGNGVIALMGGAVGGLAYPNLYKRIEFNEFTQKKSKLIGFRTTAQTKPRLVENLKSALRSGDVFLYDKQTIQELNSFVIDARTGKMAAKGSSRDDRVMALALAWEQARIIRENRAITESYRDERISYDPQTGFPMYSGDEDVKNLF